MPRITLAAAAYRHREEDLYDYEALPEDGRQAWLSLLMIGGCSILASSTLYGLIWIIS